MDIQESCSRIISGYNICNVRPILDKKSDKLLAPSRKTVRCYSTQTGLISNVIGDETLTDRIIAIQHHPSEKDQVIIVTARGVVESYDLKTSRSTFSVDIHLKEHQKKINSAGVFNYKEDSKGVFKTLLFFTLDTKKNPYFYFKEINIGTSEPTNKKFKSDVPSNGSLTIFSRHNAGPLQISFSSSGNFVSFCQGTQMSGCRLPPRKIGLNHLSEVPFTCIASHPRDEVVATGNELGQICLWYNFMDGSHPTKTILHWHSNPLSDLCFSPSGTTIYSGGQEAVVVAWEIATTKKQFFLRLGAPIKFIANDIQHRYLVVTKTDNSVDILSTDLNNRRGKVTSVNEAVKSSDPRHQISYQMHIDCLVTMSRPGHLQLIDVKGKESVKHFDVVERNLFPEDETRMSNPEVWHFCISPDCNWLLTDDGRNDGINLMEDKLKFWEFDRSKNTYVLNTVINHPHSTKVNSVTVSPDSKAVVTTSEDGSFKVWNFKPETKSWTCNHTSVCSNQPTITEACFSSDSSLIALSFGNVIKFYGISDSNFGFRDINLYEDTDSLHQVSGMCFGYFKYSNFFVEVREQIFKIWDLLRQTLFYRYENSVPIINLTIDPHSNQMTCFSTDNNLLMFSFDQKDPKKVSTEKLGSGKTWSIKPLVLPKCDHRPNSCLILFTSNHELISLDQEPGKECGGYQKPLDQGDVRLFGQVVNCGSRVVRNVHPRKVVPQFNVDRLVDQLFLKNVSHTLPPIEQLCSSFMTCLISGTNIKVEEESE